MELIDKQEAIDTILGQPPELHYPVWYAGQIRSMTPAQPKRGKWLPADSLYHGAPFYYCSECGEKMLDTVMGKPRWNFCPNCGADMREVTE